MNKDYIPVYEYMVITKLKLSDEDLRRWLNVMCNNKDWHLIAVDNGQYTFERMAENEVHGT